MYTIQDLDHLVSQAKRLCGTDPQTIAADPESVDRLRAAWAEAVALEVGLAPMAFTEYDGVFPEASYGEREIARWAKGFQSLCQKRGVDSWDTSGLGEAEDNPMGWLLQTIAVKYRLGIKVDLVNKRVLKLGTDR